MVGISRRVEGSHQLAAIAKKKKTIWYTANGRVCVRVCICYNIYNIYTWRSIRTRKKYPPPPLFVLLFTQTSRNWDPEANSSRNFQIVNFLENVNFFSSYLAENQLRGFLTSFPWAPSAPLPFGAPWNEATCLCIWGIYRSIWMYSASPPGTSSPARPGDSLPLTSE